MEIEQKDKSSPAHSIEFVEQKDRYISKLESEIKALRDLLGEVRPIDAKSNGYVNVEVNYDTLEVRVHRFGKEVIGKDCLKKVLNEHNQTEKS